jgi:hypothetical protein
MQPPILKRPAVVLNIVIYKTAKLYFRYSALFADLADQCDAMLKQLHCLKEEHPPRESDEIIALLLMNEPSLFTTPGVYADASGVLRAPLLLSEYDLNTWGRIVLPE